MKIKNPNSSPEATALRRRAEDRLPAQCPPISPSLPEAESQRLIHELHIHQIELEMQNAELLKMRTQLEESLERYVDLYDFAPAGYFTLTDNGTIQKLNLAGAALLGQERSRLLGRRLGFFVAIETLDTFNAFLNRALTDESKATCEITLQEAPLRHLYLESVRESSEAGGQCYVVAVDITERKQMEAALWENELRYRNLIELLPHGVEETDHEGRITFANPALERIHGCALGSAVGQFVWDFSVTEADRESMRDYLCYLIREQPPPTAYFSQDRHADGTKIDVEVNWTYKYDAHGQVDGFIAVITDITERKRAEQAIKASEACVWSILNASPVPLALNDEQQNITFLNTAFVQTFGYTLDDIPTLSDWWLKAYPDPAYRQWVAETWQSTLAQVKRDGTAFSPIEMKVQCKTGAVKIVLSSVAALEPAFKGTRIVMLSDVTERTSAEQMVRESNELLSSFIKHSPIFAFIKTVTPTESRVINASDNYQEMIGIPGSEIPGKTMEELFSAELAAKFTAEDWVVVSSGQVLKQDDAFNGRSYSTIKFPIIQGNKKLVGGYTTDITEQNRAENAMSQMNQELEQLVRERTASMELAYDILKQETQTRRDQEEQLAQARKLKAIGQLTGGIAHDFNNLLTIIKGNLDLLHDHAEEQTDPDQQLILDDARSATRQSIELTSALLAFSRQQPLQVKPTRVNRLMQDFERLLRQASGPAITLQINTDPQLPDILTDPGQLQAALLNLAINARDAMPKGGTLRISTALVTLPNGDGANPSLAPGRYMVVTITDTGIGMDKATLARACEPFFTTKSTGQGTGLGLSSVHGFAHQSNGGITFQSQPGRGTCVRLFLPATIAGHAPLPPEAPPVIVADTATILVVEDESRVRRLAIRYLHDLSHQVLEAANAEEAIAILETEPDLQILFSDIVIPSTMNGYDLANWVTIHRPTVKCLLTTGYSKDRGVMADSTYSRFPILPKPYSREQLAHYIASVC
jgi:PAS domain S-box-containing protein